MLAIVQHLSTTATPDWKATGNLIRESCAHPTRYESLVSQVAVLVHDPFKYPCLTAHNTLDLGEVPWHAVAACDRGLTPFSR